MKYLLLLIIPFLLVGCRQRCGDVITETYVHRYGVEVPKNDWADSGQNGKVISKLSNGVTATRSYSEGFVDGDTTFTFPHNDTIERVETYSQGNLVKETINFTSGIPMKETQFTSPNTQTITFWYENGTPRAIENYEEGKIYHAEYYSYTHQPEGGINQGQGTRPLRDAYGLLISTDNFQDGQMLTSMTYYPNGSPKELIPYRNNLVEGFKKTFLPGGEPNSVEEWVKGEQNGITTIFQNGEKSAEITYANGHKEGLEIRYRDGHIIAEQMLWHKDQLNGPAYTYVDGTTIVHWYYQGRSVTKSNYDTLSQVR